MVAREQKGDAMGRGVMTLHPAWLQILAADGQLFYMNTMPPYQVSVNFYTAPVGGTCGGTPLMRASVKCTLYLFFLQPVHADVGGRLMVSCISVQHCSMTGTYACVWPL